jgi:hypothetical protein
MVRQYQQGQTSVKIGLVAIEYRLTAITYSLSKQDVADHIAQAMEGSPCVLDESAQVKMIGLPSEGMLFNSNDIVQRTGVEPNPGLAA